MPRVILAPIFAMWFGLGMASKVALGFTLVFFIVFFNVLQGVREVSPTVLNATRMLGATRRQLLRHVYLPAALSWVFSSLHVSVGMAFVGAVIAEYLGSAKGVGYLILQAEGVFDVDTVFAGHCRADGLRAGAGCVRDAGRETAIGMATPGGHAPGYMTPQHSTNNLSCPSLRGPAWGRSNPGATGAGPCGTMTSGSSPRRPWVASSLRSSQ